MYNIYKKKIVWKRNMYARWGPTQDSLQDPVKQLVRRTAWRDESGRADLSETSMAHWHLLKQSPDSFRRVYSTVTGTTVSVNL